MNLPNGSARFAAIVPVGPDPLAFWRGVELIKSLLYWEPRLTGCVILDDSPISRGLAELSVIPSSCRVATIANPLAGHRQHGAWLGTLSSGILRAMSWIYENTDATFVLRIDADALVVGRFARVIRAFIERTPDAGIIGTLGLSCNPEIRLRQNPLWEPRILRAYTLWPRATLGDAVDDEIPVKVETFGEVSLDQRRSFDALRPAVDTAVGNGYATHEYCQGGACVVSRVMIERMSRDKHLIDAHRWAGLPFQDDGVLAMYARAVGLSLYDYSNTGEPFGVQHVGLPYAPDVLVARGHSLIHSVKNDPTYSEADIRDFFRRRIETVLKDQC
jgi:hypothetical protein